jgi:hypothetical protein
MLKTRTGRMTELRHGNGDKSAAADRKQIRNTHQDDDTRKTHVDTWSMILRVSDGTNVTENPNEIGWRDEGANSLVYAHAQEQKDIHTRLAQVDST